MLTFNQFLNEDLNAQVRMLMDIIEIKLGVEMFMSYSKTSNSIKLSKLIVPKDKRNEGIGSKAMDRVVDFANKNNLIISLTPSKDFGGSIGKLKQFYKSFGFVNNKGANKDFRFTDTMLRIPQ